MKKFLKMVFKCFVFSSVAILSIIIIGIVFSYNNEKRDFTDYIAYTSDIEKAKEIQKLDKNIAIVKYSYDDKYGLKLWNSYHPERDYLLIEIAKMYPNDDSVLVETFYIFNGNVPKKKIKIIKRVLSKIKGVSNVKINFISKEDKNESYADINLYVLKGYDEKEIERIANNIIYYKLKRNINITTVVDDPFRVYLRYRDRLADLFENNDIKRAEELLKEAKPQLDNDYYDMLKKYYSRLIENEKRTKQKEELERRIAKEPNNYKLYIEKGDSTYGLNAVIYYEKAIQLNPKMKDKLFKRIEYKILTESIPYLKEDDLWFNTSIKYYEKAMEKSKYKDVWNLKMADAYYYHIKDYQKALEYYNKIQDKNYIYDFKIEFPYESDDKNDETLLPEMPFYGHKESFINPYWIVTLTSPQPFELFFLWEGYKAIKNKDIKYAKWDNSDFLYRIYYSQNQTGLYEDALSTCKKAVEKAEKNNENPAYIYDSIIKLDLKMKKFRQAKKDSQKGSSLWKQLH